MAGFQRDYWHGSKLLAPTETKRLPHNLVKGWQEKKSNKNQCLYQVQGLQYSNGFSVLVTILILPRCLIVFLENKAQDISTTVSHCNCMFMYQVLGNSS